MNVFGYLAKQIADSPVDGRLVHLVLLGGHGAIDEDLLLGRDLQVDVRLYASQQERGEDLVERVQDVALLFLAKDSILQKKL